jgi:hypothetical protein
MLDADFAGDPSFPAQVEPDAHVILKSELSTGYLPIDVCPGD